MHASRTFSLSDLLPVGRALTKLCSPPDIACRHAQILSGCTVFLSSDLTFAYATSGSTAFRSCIVRCDVPNADNYRIKTCRLLQRNVPFCTRTVSVLPIPVNTSRTNAACRNDPPRLSDMLVQGKTRSQGAALARLLAHAVERVPVWTGAVPPPDPDLLSGEGSEPWFSPSSGRTPPPVVDAGPGRAVLANSGPQLRHRVVVLANALKLQQSGKKSSARS
ncbi:uncharacterized protein PHACADRAFT_212695 [Phanerochaete carnosa HHB-10118-sp]|uniref:Uncharacterized protein n=1 Tax=Phanerochaete carnosa (strain HHB-10118-sp) TaxID=650164 RepID=K5WP45_PHACS|nr:uncharacterized protein PHACADRAFT_212695 [Phanerochaete carnosa HHB-10118-sp]EKM52107.1 hypothetical protein PHACADRAFT_212695 [Phanerochaete carnosa HHB-10118-sp]